MLPALVVFDCDGVLVDSETIANRIMAECITAAGLPITYEDCRSRFVGGTLQRVIDTVEQWLGRPLPPDWKADFETRRDAAFRAELQPVPGVAAAIETIRASGVPICVASSGNLEKMDLTLGLTGLKEHFEGRIFSATMVARGKPHPDLFLFAAEQMGQMPETCVVVEDSLLGTAAGIAAGMRVLAYAAETDSDALTAAGGQTFTDMRALPGLLGIGATARMGAAD
ncbi:HAD family phosphatase [Pelagibius sp.]|uniref:HAD family hydrolase n=1 Tax=Pelagibius sp. TaxID=1931238 RepID=UPI0026211426|nr:HAD family hydrolase [Pelagibius sp.]